MSRRARTASLAPGYGDMAVVVSPSGREWTGEVIFWLLGCPFLRTETESRWFPAHWVREVAEGNHPEPEPESEEDEQ